MRLKIHPIPNKIVFLKDSFHIRKLSPLNKTENDKRMATFSTVHYFHTICVMSKESVTMLSKKMS